MTEWGSEAQFRQSEKRRTNGEVGGGKGGDIIGSCGISNWEGWGTKHLQFASVIADISNVVTLLRTECGKDANM